VNNDEDDEIAYDIPLSGNVRAGFVRCIDSSKEKRWVRITEIKTIAPMNDNACMISTYKDTYYVALISDDELLDLIEGGC